MTFFGTNRLLIFLAGGIFLVLFCEVLIYWLVLLTCTWPQLSSAKEKSESLRAMLIADTHLLGSREGHWFDRLRREWQMQRSFQTAMTVHSPDVVFVLGDLLDEGKWASDQEFQETVERFHRMFSTPSHTDLQVVIGNHDVGFHYRSNPHLNRRFNKAWNTDSVKLLHVKGNAFVLINSVAMEGDRCEFCAEAEAQLKRVSHSLQCSMGQYTTEQCPEESMNQVASRPIILQHYPMYRPSDKMCEGPDAAEGREKTQRFRERWDCISQDSTKKIFKSLNPRLIFSAHTHHGCFVKHPPEGVPEWTVASFNWRNRNNPVFLLAVIHKDDFAVEKCFLPKESTVIFIYIVGGTVLFLYLTFPRRFLFRNQRKRL